MPPAGRLRGASRQPDPLQGGPPGATEASVQLSGVGTLGVNQTPAPKGREGEGKRRKPKADDRDGDERPAISAMRMGGVPVDRLLTTVRGPISIEVESQPGAEIEGANFRVDDGPAEPLARVGRIWRGEVQADRLSDGPHHVEVEVREAQGGVETSKGTFTVRRRPV